LPQRCGADLLKENSNSYDTERESKGVVQRFEIHNNSVLNVSGYKIKKCDSHHNKIAATLLVDEILSDRGLLVGAGRERFWNQVRFELSLIK
jgi:hypothetical protein